MIDGILGLLGPGAGRLGTAIMNDILCVQRNEDLCRHQKDLNLKDLNSNECVHATFKI